MFWKRFQSKTNSVIPKFVLETFLSKNKLSNSKVCFGNVFAAKTNSVIPKFHYFQHILDDMKLYGSTRNYDGATSESNFKLMFKKPASQTQKRHRVFDEQFLKNYQLNINTTKLKNE